MYKYYGPTQQTAEIISVNPASMEITAALLDGGLVAIDPGVVNDLFRWPIKGEHWNIQRNIQNPNLWNLADRVQNRTIVDGSTYLGELNPVTSLNPGEARIDAEKIYDGKGRRLYTEEEYEALEARVAALEAALEGP